MDLASDVDILFSDLGVPAVISQPGNPDITTTVLFDTHSTDELGVWTEKPLAAFRATDLADIDIKTATVALAGETWKIVKPIADGTGLVIAGMQKSQ